MAIRNPPDLVPNGVEVWDEGRASEGDDAPELSRIGASKRFFKDPSLLGILGGPFRSFGLCKVLSPGDITEDDFGKSPVGERGTLSVLSTSHILI